MDSSDRQVDTERRGDVLWLTIRREERRNAMSHGVRATLDGAIAGAWTPRKGR